MAWIATGVLASSLAGELIDSLQYFSVVRPTNELMMRRIRASATNSRGAIERPKPIATLQTRQMELVERKELGSLVVSYNIAAFYNHPFEWPGRGRLLNVCPLESSAVIM